MIWNRIFRDRLLARFAMRRAAIGDRLIDEGNNPGTAHLMQGLASGLVTADDLRGLREHSPLFVAMLADGLGVPIARLNDMAQAGRLTRSVIEKAMVRAGRRREQSGQPLRARWRHRGRRNPLSRIPYTPPPGDPGTPPPPRNSPPPSLAQGIDQQALARVWCAAYAAHRDFQSADAAVRAFVALMVSPR